MGMRVSRRKVAAVAVDRIVGGEPVANVVRSVAGYLLQGMTSKLIGRSLAISPRTVEVHKGRVMDKLGTKTLAELLRRAMQQSK